MLLYCLSEVQHLDHMLSLCFNKYDASRMGVFWIMMQQTVHLPSVGIFAQTFRRLQARGVVPQVLYPAVQLPSVGALQISQQQWQHEVSPELAQFMQSGPLFVSINRFERKKVSPNPTWPPCVALAAGTYPCRHLQI